MFWPNLAFLVPSYFDHDAFMHHALHVLDAPGGRCRSPGFMITIPTNRAAMIHSQRERVTVLLIKM